jgi:drug/metabolite transporter (DMT)-like permease
MCAPTEASTRARKSARIWQRARADFATLKHHAFIFESLGARVMKLNSALAGASLIGLVAGLTCALIGGSWQVVTRQSTTGTLGRGDLVWLRYFIPALVLLPLILRMGLLPAGVPRRSLALMLLGSGLPFGLLAMTGSRYAPAAHMGVLMAGAAPLFTALFAWMFFSERPDRWRSCGLAFMAVGAALLGAKALSGSALAGAWRGDLLFLLAAASWSCFTLTFRRSGLTPWQGAALVNTWSALLLLPWLCWLLWQGQFHLFDAPPRDLMWQALWQGVLAGLLGLWTFNVAIHRLGAAAAAAFGALAPVVSALGGWWWLGESLTATDTLAVGCAVVGVALASGVLGSKAFDASAQRLTRN